MPEEKTVWIEIPEEWVKNWDKFDEVFVDLSERAADGLSRQDVYAAFRPWTFDRGRSVSPWRDPFFRLWAAARVGAACYGEFQFILMGWRSDRLEFGGYPPGDADLSRFARAPRVD